MTREIKFKNLYLFKGESTHFQQGRQIATKESCASCLKTQGQIDLLCEQQAKKQTKMKAKLKTLKQRMRNQEVEINNLKSELNRKQNTDSCSQSPITITLQHDSQTKKMELYYEDDHYEKLPDNKWNTYTDSRNVSDSYSFGALKINEISVDKDETFAKMLAINNEPTQNSDIYSYYNPNEESVSELHSRFLDNDVYQAPGNKNYFFPQKNAQDRSPVPTGNVDVTSRSRDETPSEDNYWAYRPHHAISQSIGETNRWDSCYLTPVLKQNLYASPDSNNEMNHHNPSSTRPTGEIEAYSWQQLTSHSHNRDNEPTPCTTALGDQASAQYVSELQFNNRERSLNAIKQYTASGPHKGYIEFVSSNISNLVASAGNMSSTENIVQKEEIYV